jgi:hypothetical protein
MGGLCARFRDMLVMFVAYWALRARYRAPTTNVATATAKRVRCAPQDCVGATSCARANPEYGIDIQYKRSFAATFTMFLLPLDTMKSGWHKCWWHAGRRRCGCGARMTPTPSVCFALECKNNKRKAFPIWKKRRNRPRQRTLTWQQTTLYP